MKTVHIKFGEDRSGMRASNRLYFFYVSPTGTEASMSTAKEALSPKWSRNSGESPSGRVMEVEYNIHQPCTIKMVSLCSVFGKPRQNFCVYINLNGVFQKIRITGAEGFGEFVGHGEIDFERTGLSEDFLKEGYGYEILAPGISSNDNKANRKLIW